MSPVVIAFLTLYELVSSLVGKYRQTQCCHDL
jgi:hypothetical protein